MTGTNVLKTNKSSSLAEIFQIDINKCCLVSDYSENSTNLFLLTSLQISTNRQEKKEIRNSSKNLQLPPFPWANKAKNRMIKAERENQWWK